MSYTHGLCTSCDEESCSKCEGCHNENCELYTEEKFCPDCGKEICHSCDVCHTCGKNSVVEDTVSSLSEVTSEKSYMLEPIHKWNEDLNKLIGDDWVSEALEGIKAVKPIMAIYPVPNKKDHNATNSIGIVVVKMFRDSNVLWGNGFEATKIVKSEPIYRIISFPFKYGMSPSGSCKIVYPREFRISPVFLIGAINTEFLVKHLYNYVVGELASWMYPAFLKDNKWIIHILVKPEDLLDDVFCKFVNANIPLIPKSGTKFIKIEGAYDYSEYECQ